MLKKDAYTSTQVLRALGLSYRQLVWWDSQGYVSPSGRAGRPGSGLWRRYSLRDVAALEAARRLREMGVPLPQARRALALLRDSLPVPTPEGAVLLADGRGRALIAADPAEIAAFILRSDAAVCLPVGRIIREAERALEDARRKSS
ncbi:MAG: MerR family transcriptional regulator [Firmicutes bacterium]|nr:MerR family transcriptional regulator [Bacillota bacterium]